MRSPIYVGLALVGLLGLLGVSRASSSAAPIDGADPATAPICQTAAPLRGDRGEWLTTATDPAVAVSVLTALKPIVPEEELRLIDDVVPYFSAKQSSQTNAGRDVTRDNELAQQEIHVSARVALLGVWLKGTCDF